MHSTYCCLPHHSQEHFISDRIRPLSPTSVCLLMLVRGRFSAPTSLLITVVVTSDENEHVHSSEMRLCLINSDVQILNAFFGQTKRCDENGGIITPCTRLSSRRARSLLVYRLSSNARIESSVISPVWMIFSAFIGTCSNLSTRFARRHNANGFLTQSRTQQPSFWILRCRNFPAHT